MNFGPIIEVAIGIIFVWIVLSLTTIQVQEWINTFLDKRARDMEEAIEEMLANENRGGQNETGTLLKIDLLVAGPFSPILTSLSVISGQNIRLGANETSTRLEGAQ